VGVNVQEVIKELFGKLGYKDGGRFFDMENQDPQLAQMQKTIEELQQALAAKQDPQLVAAMIRKIDADIVSMGVKDKDTQAATQKKGVEASFSAMQTAEVLAAVPEVAPIADAIMQSAGGTDPNFMGGTGVSALSIQPVTNKRTGIGFMPGGDTSPQTPMTPGVGVQQGIHTMEADSVGV
jgi:hypothetical protein